MATAQDNPKRAAFFGGSFDPPHLGHLAVARAARDALGLDAVLFAPVGMQPLKPKGSTAPFEDRVAMTELAIGHESGFAITRIDSPISTGKPNYTIDTLRQLSSELPDAELFCLMGADSFVSLKHWHGAEAIPFAASLVVASRPGKSLDDLTASLPEGVTIEGPIVRAQSCDPSIELSSCALRNSSGRTASLYVLPCLDVEISASDIRSALRGPIDISRARPYVLESVARYIRERSLYQ